LYPSKKKCYINQATILVYKRQHFFHYSIKTGSKERDAYIANYCTTLENLGEAGLNLVCYNFMAVFDWTRSDLAKKDLTARQ